MWIFNVAFSLCLLLSPEKKGELLLQIKNIEVAEGVIRLAIYNRAEIFLKTGSEFASTSKLVKNSKDLQVAIPNLPFGSYAVAIYHDINNNGQLDKNYLGIPTEPYAFSNNPKVKWRSPTYSETEIELNAQQKDLHLELKRWKKY